MAHCEYDRACCRHTTDMPTTQGKSQNIAASVYKPLLRNNLCFALRFAQSSSTHLEQRLKSLNKSLLRASRSVGSGSTCGGSGGSGGSSASSTRDRLMGGGSRHGVAASIERVVSDVRPVEAASLGTWRWI